MKHVLRNVLIFSVLICFTAQAQDFYYMGVGDPSSSNCMCHAQTVTSWSNTGHATAQDSVESLAYYGYSCLECHNTGWDTEVDNNGADEYVEAGENNAYTITNQEEWDKRKNVQCESCHGPVGNQDGTMNAAHMAADNVTYSADNCGSCHNGEHHPYYAEWEESGHASGAPVWFTRENNGDCYYCHFAQDFVAFLEDAEYDGKTFEPTGELQILTCATCHDPHGNDNPGDIRDYEDGKAICDACHNSHTEEVDVTATPHHTTSEAFDGVAYFGFQYEGESYQNSLHTMVLNDRCVACHVHSTPYDDETHMAKTGHTFEPRVEACAECHSDYYTAVDTSNHDARFDYRGVQTEIKGLLEELGTKLEAASSEDSLTDAFLQANFNYLSVEAEGSYGIHNTKLVKKLLEDAIARFTPTAVEDTEVMPTEFGLNQNYPNPFNPSTTITFAVPEAGNVKITIFDVTGTEVATLADRSFNVGTYSVSWNAASQVSGVYFYRMEAGNFVSTKKMLLVK